MTSSTTHAPTPPASESTEPTSVDVAAWDARAEEPRHAAWTLHHSLEPRGRHRLKQSAVRPPAAALVSGLVYLATAGRVRVGHARNALIRTGARRRTPTHVLPQAHSVVELTPAAESPAGVHLPAVVEVPAIAALPLQQGPPESSSVTPASTKAPRVDDSVAAEPTADVTATTETTSESAPAETKPAE